MRKIIFNSSNYTIMRKSFKWILFFVFIFFLCNSKLFSQEDKPHPIDAYLDSCMEKNPSTQSMTNCTYEAEKMWDVELNKYYKLLMTVLDDDSKESLKSSEVEWIKFKEKEIINIGNIYSKMEGTMYIPMRAFEIMDITKWRALQLKNYYDLITGN